MRHGNGLRKLNRTSAHRKALLQNLANALIEHEAVSYTHLTLPTTPYV